MTDAISLREDGPILTWLSEMVQFQGISDAVAENYLAKHGNPDSMVIEASLDPGNLCPKLRTYWSFEHCGYRKASWACGEPDHRVDCPLPQLPLRNGRLNQTVYALVLFFRDVCDGDFTAWVDAQVARADHPEAPDRNELLAEAMIGPMRNIFGVSDKVLTMSLSTILLSETPRRPLWAAAGGAMIAIDTLVHNWLHRTGLLSELGRAHVYGEACYTRGNCSDIVRRLSAAIDAREFNPDFPAHFPRFVQNAIWRFCAASELNRCNGTNIDDRFACTVDCELTNHCARNPLHPQSTKPRE